MTDTKLPVDATIAAADRTLQLAAENEQLKTKLAEHELLFAYAKERDDFLEAMLAGLAHQLPPGTKRTVEAIVDAVADMALKLDAHEDASTPAFDEIAKLCGCPQWDYPGQIVRDVERLVQERDFWKSQTNALTPAFVTMTERLRVAEVVRDEARVASNRYIEEKRQALATAEACREDQRALATRRDELLQVIARLSNTVPFPDEWKDWESTRAKLVAEIGTLRNRVASLEDMAKEAHVETIRKQQLMLADTNWLRAAWDAEIEKNKELRKQKDGAYDERDRCVAALAAMATRLGWSAWLGRHVGDPWDDDWRNIVFINLPFGQVSWHIHDSELPWFSFLPSVPERPWDGHTTEQKYERLAMLSRGLEASTQCPWILPDEDPDEGYWHCKLGVGHSEKHVTEFGKGLDQRWYMPCEGNAHTFVGDCCRDCLLPVSGGPTLGGEDLSPDPAIRRAQIEAVVMGTEAPLALSCNCSPKYIELATGVHAKYCALAGQPLTTDVGAGAASRVT